LRKAGVGFRAIELVTLDKRPEVVDALSIARALVNPADRTAWLGVLRAPWCGLTLEELHRLTSDDNRDILEMPVPLLLQDRPEELHRAGRLDARACEAALRVGRVMRRAAEARAAGGAAALGTWIESVWKALGGGDTVNAEERENLRLLWAALDKLEGGELDLLGPELKAALAKLCALPDPATSSDFGVQLMTIHKSKGLEFEVVIVLDLETSGQNRARTLVSWLERGLPSSSSVNGEVTEFLVAPIQGKGEDAGPAKQWVDGVKRERERQELRRILYVAATRAREELHLFARPRYALKVREGQRVLDAAKGLLATAWPAFGAEIELRFAGWVQRQDREFAVALAAEATGTVENNLVQMNLALARPLQPLHMRRLPAGHAVPELRWRGASGAQDGNTSAMDAIAPEEALYTRTEGGQRSRMEGTAIHFLLERLAYLRMGLDPGPAAAAVADALPQVIAAVRGQGVASAAARRLAADALDVVQRASTHPAGAWLLAPHAQAKAEIRWTGVWDGQARNIRPDRVFLAPAPTEDWCNTAGDEQDPPERQLFWWIVDYKTSHAAGIDLSNRSQRAAYLAIQREKHRGQLAIYAHLLQQLLVPVADKGSDHAAVTPSIAMPDVAMRIIRTGVFYPRLRLFDCWNALPPSHEMG
jgi:ATP-dependent exoDNAse (exonuclease V) beta subunit